MAKGTMARCAHTIYGTAPNRVSGNADLGAILLQLQGQDLALGSAGRRPGDSRERHG